MTVRETLLAERPELPQRWEEARFEIGMGDGVVVFELFIREVEGGYQLVLRESEEDGRG